MKKVSKNLTGLIGLAFVFGFSGCGSESKSGGATSAFVPTKHIPKSIQKLTPSDIQPDDGSMQAYMLKRINEVRNSGGIDENNISQEAISTILKTNDTVSETVSDWADALSLKTYEDFKEKALPYRVDNDNDGKYESTAQSRLFNNTLKEHGIQIGASFSKWDTWGDDSNMTNWYNTHHAYFNAGKDPVCGFSPIYDIEPHQYEGVMVDKGIVMICGNFSKKQ